MNYSRDLTAINGRSAVERTSDVVLQTIRRMIVTLELRPGATVTEERLAGLLNCSRTPVREALQRLASGQLGELVPRRGFVVADMSILTFPQLMEALSIVSENAARLAGERMTPALLQKLEGILGAFEAKIGSGDYAGLVELDAQFHQTVGEAAQNLYLARAIVPLAWLVGRYEYMVLRTTNDPTSSHLEHRAVVEALDRGDADAAAKLMRLHVTTAAERMLASIQTPDRLPHPPSACLTPGPTIV